MTDQYSIGIDIGGTNLRGGVVDQNHQIIKEVSRKTPDNFVDFKKAVDDLCWQLNEDFDFPLRRGIAQPGLIDRARQMIVISPNLQFLNGVAFDKICDGAVIANDVDMALFGEMEKNPELSENTVLLVNIGTGIGGALYLKGVGSWDLNIPTEIGHVVVMPGGRQCGCGNKGCLEAYFSATALLGQAKEKISGEIDSVEKLFDLATKKDKKAELIIEEGCVALGTSLASLINILGVDTVLIGGKVGNSFELFSDQVCTIAKRHLFGKEDFALKKATLIDAGGIIGAATFALKN